MPSSYWGNLLFINKKFSVSIMIVYGFHMMNNCSTCLILIKCTFMCGFFALMINSFDKKLSHPFPLVS